MIGIIAGTGFDLPSGGHAIQTPYGPSGPVARAALGGREVLTMARHGVGHSVPPHRINYRANIWALGDLGADRIVSLGAVGNLRPDWEIGDVVLCDQFVNRTWGREDTFFDGPDVRHAIVSEPYCSELRQHVGASMAAASLPVREDGVLLIIQGPRYSTRAENRDWRTLGYDVISMTHYPEVVLARELGLCFASVCVITDHASVLGDPRSQAHSDGHATVVANLRRIGSRVWDSLAAATATAETERSCDCRRLGNG
jgi:5'-methylthioadenosine phosphorylase